MKVIVIPDVHLKPWIFNWAEELLNKGKAERAVCLMDIADDWNKTFQIQCYADTYDRAIRFAADHPETLWCYGNHDVCYLWNQRESGYSPMAPWTVCSKLAELERTVPEGNLGFIHRVDRVLFSHGGLSEVFVRTYISEEKRDDVDAVTKIINTFGFSELWQDESPIWLRPQLESFPLYKPEEYLQVVGHTPMEDITREGNLLSCDVFSTGRSGRPTGSQQFAVVDTESWEWEAARP